MRQGHEPPLTLDERTQLAVAELQATISRRYPTASFVVARSPDDPHSVHLEAIVDVDDPDEVGDLVVDRVVELQAEEGIPVHVISLRPPERIAAARDAQTTRGAHQVRGVPLFRTSLSHPN